MVQLPNPDNFRSESKQPNTPALVTVKAEIEDSLDEMYGPLDKRSRIADPVEQLENKLIPPCSFYDPLDEPSPLGLRLKKSPSFLDMIQMRLYQENSASTSSTTGPGLDVGKKKELKSTAVSSSLDKMKASNFPASILKIGSWEYASRYEGDLVAKCYYAKHKLVWEVLDGGLKNKIEIQWSDITALKAACPENGSATLDIVLARRPLFFRETNPQPRKHTLWQATSDFTGGQASIHKRHFLQCHQGLLNRHFEKLIQCDPRLKTLNQQPEIVLESACFEPACFEDHDESKCLGFENVKDNHRSTDGFHEPKLPCAKTESRDRVDAVLDISAGQMHFRDAAAGASVISVHNKAIEDNVYNENRQASKPWMQWEQQLKAPRLRSSMSKDDLVNHLEHCISEQLASGNPLFSAGCLPDKGKLEELADHLLTDSHAFVSDEKSLISKVNSFCSLLQKDPSFQNLHSTSTEHRQYFEEEEEEEEDDDDDDEHKQFIERKAAADDLQPCGGGMARKESFGELLMNLPRIASFPQFLFCIAEDNDD